MACITDAELAELESHLNEIAAAAPAAAAGLGDHAAAGWPEAPDHRPMPPLAFAQMVALVQAARAIPGLVGRIHSHQDYIREIRDTIAALAKRRTG